MVFDQKNPYIYWSRLPLSQVRRNYRIFYIYISNLISYNLPRSGLQILHKAVEEINFPYILNLYSISISSPKRRKEEKPTRAIISSRWALLFLASKVFWDP
ncbi:hypothetical protein I7I48_10534 [Histoplasma ohiense]|nr:hypothetical protein I7I48_10534 [Histoplasma ohiense (nom. inval.)]